MKTIKTLFAILFLSTFFIACEAESINEEVGLEFEDTIGTDGQDVDQEVQPGNG